MSALRSLSLLDASRESGVYPRPKFLRAVHVPQPDAGLPIAEDPDSAPEHAPLSIRHERAQVRLCSDKRTKMREAMAAKLDAAIRECGYSNADIAACWDMNAEAVRQIRSGERVFAAECILLLPPDVRTVLINRIDNGGS